MDLIPDFLPLPLIDKIFEHAKNEKLTRSNYLSWQGGLIDASPIILVWLIEGELAEEIKSVFRQKLLGPEKHYDTFGISIHMGSRGSYIAWHGDDHAKHAVTVYLNKEWNPNWGGYTIVGGPDPPGQAVLPVFNRALSFASPLMHYLTPTAMHAPPRWTLQAFIGKR